MNEQIDRIDVEEHQAAIRPMDYIVAGGEVYQVKTDSPYGDVYLLSVDEVPEKYWERWGEEA